MASNRSEYSHVGHCVSLLEPLNVGVVQVVKKTSVLEGYHKMDWILGWQKEWLSGYQERQDAVNRI